MLALAVVLLTFAGTACSPAPIPPPPVAEPNPVTTSPQPALVQTAGASTPSTTNNESSVTPSPATNLMATPIVTSLHEVSPVSPPPDPRSIHIRLDKAVGGLDHPTFLTHAGDGSGRMWIVEKAGVIRVTTSGQSAAPPAAPATYLDIHARVGSDSSEQGLLGLAFHPKFKANGRFFVDYTDRSGNTVVSEFHDPLDGSPVDAAAERVLLRVDQPAANHNGGMVVFGQDGYLYIGLGDGGGAGDRYGNGQNPRALLAKLLRVDVDRGEPYAIPPDNPFAKDEQFRPETWAYGLRNPWRFSFDRLTGDLYIGDVGQNTYEEVDFQLAASHGGQNYGWPIVEGNHCFARDAGCDAAGHTVRPIIEYAHSDGNSCSITGGYVYRGTREAGLAGAYFYGDYCSGRIWAAARAAGNAWQTGLAAQTKLSISSFGEDEAGELYVLDYGGGAAYRIASGQP